MESGSVRQYHLPSALNPYEALILEKIEGRKNKKRGVYEKRRYWLIYIWW